MCAKGATLMKYNVTVKHTEHRKHLFCVEADNWDDAYVLGSKAGESHNFGRDEVIEHYAHIIGVKRSDGSKEVWQ